MPRVGFAGLGLATAVLALLPTLVPSTGHAEVWQDRVIECEPGTDFLALTASSHILYVNDCLPNGCVVQNGSDSSLTDTTSISQNGQTITMQPYMHGEAHWNDVITCVKEAFAPFDIQVVTEDPGPGTPHYEVMAAGTSAQLNPNIMGAGGIAPFISCNAQRNNLLAFVFANQTSSKDYLCNAIAHEAGHVYGLSHSLDARDPMTYMELGERKAWTNSEQTCGTETPQNCRCFPDTQNSFRYLNNTFGLAPGIGDATIAIASPGDGRWVKPGFGIGAVFSTPLRTLEAHMALDNGTQQDAQNGVLAWNAPATIGAGPHAVTVTATDYGDRTATHTITVNVTATCSAGQACDDGFGCLGGFCLPGTAYEGGLGATCTSNGDCITGQCASDGTSSYCTGSCDPGNTCPAGYDCLADANVCWPAESGGCRAAHRSPGSLVLLLGGVLLGLRRRRR